MNRETHKKEERIVYLMRHAKPDLPHNGKIYYGDTDFPLCEEGRQRAAAVGLKLRTELDVKHCFTSDMQRAKETAELVFPGASATEVPGLREINLGEWETRTYDEVRSEFTELYETRGACFASVAPPGGETFTELQNRTVPAFEEILAANPDGDIFIVAHGAVIWSIMSYCFNFDLNDMFFFPQDYCAVHAIKESCGQKKLIRYNWTPELR